MDAQSGGRKREGAPKAKKTFSLKKRRSAGHSDQFARSNGKKNIFTRLFYRDPGAWAYRSNGTNKKNWKENRFLFTRHRSPGRVENSKMQDRQNAKRAKKRDRGNESFSKKKYPR